MNKFKNLHLHTEYSLNDSVIRIPQLVKTLKEYKQDTCAITDHSSCAGWIEFNQECEKNNIKPIFGNEFYCQTNYEKKTKDRDHLVVLAKTDEGVKRIRELQKIAVENFYYKPILSYETLLQNTDGLYCTSACSLGTISKLLLNNNYEKAYDFAGTLYDAFNKDFSLELQMHPGYADQRIINFELLRLHDETGIPLTVSTDAHFINEENRDLRRVVQASAWHKLYTEIQETLKSNCVGNDEIVKQNAVEAHFRETDIVEKAIKQTDKIAKTCNGKLPTPKREIPVFDKYTRYEELLAQQIW